ncbi:MAG TPA: CBS domain-containing protein [Gemmataceae bacterium]|nr:CBS domain-containing protein [Gemmataceae bacterium]
MPLSSTNLDAPVRDHLRRDFTRLRPEWTVGEATARLREHPSAAKIDYFYVVDDKDRLHGVATARALVTSPADRPLTEVMIREVETLPATATVREACEKMRRRRLLALPVVDDAGGLIGVVDAELYTEEIRRLDDPAVRDDLFQQIGVHAADATPRSPWRAFRRRFPWLGCNLAAGLLAAFLSSVFEKMLSQVVLLAFFFPLVLNLAESVSSQSVSLALQLLHGKPPTWRLMASRLHREARTGVLLGLGAGAVVALAALVWRGNVQVSLALLGGIAGGVAVSAVLGMVLPIGLRLLRLDPRVAAGPIALAAADVITILCYLTLAQWLLHG